MKITAYSQPLRPSFKAQFDYSGLNEHQQRELRDFIINSDTVKLKSLKKDTIILKEQNADLAKQNQKIIEQNTSNLCIGNKKKINFKDKTNK